MVTDSPVDLDAVERAAAHFLTALGIDLDRDERRATPARMARAFAGLLDTEPFQLTTFPNDDGYTELALARAIPFRTLCEDHMLLFSGVAHVGYLPRDRIIGLSNLARIVEHFAAQPQTQERLTRQIAECLDENLRPGGVGVVLAAEHNCVTQRDTPAFGAITVTSVMMGSLRTDHRCRAELFALADVDVTAQAGR
jgi:GTP cyclohydrolase IA